MQKKRITVVSFNSSAGLVYQRAHIPFRHLRDIYDFEFIDLSDIRHVDLFYTDALVFVHGWSEEFTYLAERARYHYQVPVILDIDDLLMDIPIDHPEYENIKGRSLNNTIQLAAACVYSTPYLKMRLRHLNKNCTVIENTLPEHVFSGYNQPKRPHKNSFVIGWTGGQSHRSDQLCTFYSGVRQFLLDHDDSRAHFHGLCPQELQRELGAQVFFDSQMVDYMDYHAAVENYPFDVCLVGLIDHPFNHAKSDLRLIDMAPHQIPIIASPRSDFLKHKEKELCLYAEDNHPDYMSWYDAIKYAKNHPEEMQQMAGRAWEYTKEERLSTRASEKWFHVIEKAISSTGQTPQMGRSLLAHSLELTPLD